MKDILIIVFVVLLTSACSPGGEAVNVEKGEFYKLNQTQIVKIRNCEYVFWHNGYGSDMEHYEGCENKEHK